MDEGAVLGLDVGGAHVKTARADGAGVRAATRAFPLWQDPGGLVDALRAAAAAVDGERAPAVAVTMTAELADCFETKAQGVAFVLDAVASAFPGREVLVFHADAGFWPADRARRDPLAVASANWRATAELVARTAGDAWLLDVGSTTTDVVPVVGGAVAAVGRTDPDRLAAGELVYTGAVRTPACAILRRVTVNGRRYRVAAEWFAVAGDAHLWLGDLDPEAYAGPTPDGRGKSRAEAGARLARMVCADRTIWSDDAVTAIARAIAAAQVRAIAGAVREVRARLGARAPTRAVVVGAGAFLGARAARRAGLRTVPAPEPFRGEGSRAAPAVAVACLCREALGRRP